MGVDFYPCSGCNDVYCDCGDYGRCYECGKGFCMKCVDYGVISKYSHKYMERQTLKLNREVRDIMKKYESQKAIIRDHLYPKDIVNKPENNVTYQDNEDNEDDEDDEDGEDGEDGEDDDKEYYCEDCAEGKGTEVAKTPVWDKINDNQYKLEFAYKMLGLTEHEFMNLIKRDAFIKEIENEINSLPSKSVNHC